MEMETVERVSMEHDLDVDLQLESEVEEGEGDDDLCKSILSRFGNGNSTKARHHHICTVIGTISQELKEENHPPTNLAYFCATYSSLDKLTSSANPPTHIVDALLAILSMVLPPLSPPVLRKKSSDVSELLVRVIRSNYVADSSAASALKCISHLLIVARLSSSTWPDVSHLFGILMGFIADGRPKARKQAHLCLPHVMQSFQGTSMLSPASEAIANTFERFLLLAGGSGSGSDSKASQGPRGGAQEVLYVLDSLRDCLPCISLKSSTNILKYFKPLLELRQNQVTRRVTDALYFLCLQPTPEVSPDPEVLMDLLCSLAVSLSADEASGDGMTFIGRLLHVGTKKVFSLNRQICVAKLPVVFNAFKDVLASEHEEPLLVATEGLKGLIHTCIDESLIKQGVDQIKGDGCSRKSAPAIILKLCAVVESLLDYSYAAVWDKSFQVVSAMFDRLGESCSYFLNGTLKNLADIQKLPDEDFLYRKQLHECIGSALVAMGPRTFLDILPLNLEVDDLSEANAWLFPILKQRMIGAHLSYFEKSLLPMVATLKKKSAMLEQEGRIHSARIVDGLVYSLWSLFPSFCNYSHDTAESFKDLEEQLRCSLREDPNSRGVICCGLQILVQQNKRIAEGKNELTAKELGVCEKRAISYCTPEIAVCNLNVLRSSAQAILSLLSEIFIKSSNDDGGSLQKTISEFAAVAGKHEVGRHFKKTMQMLLKVTQEAGKTQTARSSMSMEIDRSSSATSSSLPRAKLFDLAASLLPGLVPEEVDLLFLAIKPALKDLDSLIQKKAYKVLSIILEKADGFISRKHEDLLKLVSEVKDSCHFSAKPHRLNCIYFLLVHVSKGEYERSWDGAVTSFLTEIVLALKEANKKTRNRAYDILIQIGHSYVDEEKGGNKEKLHQFFCKVAGGLLGRTPHMVSATVKGMARLTYDFSDLVSSAFNDLPTILLLFRREEGEIIKATLGLLKVLVAKSQAEGLRIHLKIMVEALLKCQDGTKNHFKAKVKLLLEMLVKKCGFDAVKNVMPKEHIKLLTNIRKIKERKERKLASNTVETRSHLSKATSRLSRWNHSKIFSDFGDEAADGGSTVYMDRMTVSVGNGKVDSLLHSNRSSLGPKRMRIAEKSLPEDSFDRLDDEPLDLLDRQRTRSSLRSCQHQLHKRKLQTDEEPEIGPEGRLVIREDGAMPKGKMPTDTVSDFIGEAGSDVVSVNSRGAEKRRKTTGSGWAYTGSEYSSKRARGDVKRKDKLEPYAYWPLDRKMVSRRPEHRAAARRGMSSVVKLTKGLEGKSVSNANASSIKSLMFKRGKRKTHMKHRMGKAQ